MAKQSSTIFLDMLPAPARRALEKKGITTVQKLAKFSEAEIMNLHGIGKTSMPTLRDALGKNSLSFKEAESIKAGKSADIDGYIAAFPKETQQKLQQVRAQIKKTAPLAEETISYGIPAFKLNGYQLVYFAGYKNHIGLYPAPVTSPLFKKELSAYKTGKGTVQFPLDQPLPLDLISRIVKFRANENIEKQKTRKSKSGSPAKTKPSKLSEEEKINSYLDKMEETTKAEVEAIRNAIKKAGPLLEERITWNAPSYHYKEMDLLTFGPHKDNRLMLVFHHPAIVKIKSPLLEGTYKDRRLMYFRGKTDISRKKKDLENIIREFTQLAGVPG
jgi:uncharacterized protein YdhG (YjbR/CyaY superfamily)